LGSVPFFTIDNSKIVRRRKKELLLFTGFRFESCGSPLHLMNKLRITYKDGYYNASEAIRKRYPDYRIR
jgi:hypothetical protein